MRYGGCFEISFEQFTKNISIIQSEFINSQIMLMVKANAYGHGILAITKFAYNRLKINSFGCATLAEAIYIRKSIKGTFDLYVFSETSLDQKNQQELYLDYNIIPVISNLSDFNLVIKNAEFKFLPLVLKFNTGMNRLGLEINDLELIIRALRRNKRPVKHLMTHFACASLSMNNSHNQRQLNSFSIIKSEFKINNIEVEHSSISNSGAIEQKVGGNESFIRPGLLAYGHRSVIKDNLLKINWNGDLIGSLKAKVLWVKNIKKGTPIGYGGNPCPDSGILAIVGLGYGDGLSCSYEGCDFTYEGKLIKIVGRVNMDMCHVLFSDDAKIKRNDWIEFWGRKSTNFDLFCHKGKKNPYEALCSLSPRLPRLYLDTNGLLCKE